MALRAVIAPYLHPQHNACRDQHQAETCHLWLLKTGNFVAANKPEIERLASTAKNKTLVCARDGQGGSTPPLTHRAHRSTEKFQGEIVLWSNDGMDGLPRVLSSTGSSQADPVATGATSAPLFLDCPLLDLVLLRSAAQLVH